MPDDDEIEAAAPATSGRSLFRRKAGESVPAESDAEPAPAAAPAKKARRPMPESTKRLIFIIGGIFVLVGSVLGFYLTSDAFDERVAVLVAARHIDAGETLSAADFGSDLVVVGAIPYVPWTPETPSAVREHGGVAGDPRGFARALRDAPRG